MGLRIRKANGEIVPVPEGHFVEIFNEFDDSVGMVFFQPTPGTVIHISPNSQDAARYSQMFKSQGLKFTRTIINKEAT